MIIVTQHAKMRSKQRIGLPQKAVVRQACKAMANGIMPETAPNSELRFYLNTVKGGDPMITPVLYGTHVYVFKRQSNHDFLITVLHQKQGNSLL